MGCGFCGICRYSNVVRLCFLREDPVQTIEDLKSKKLRVWARDQVEAFTRLGVSAQIIPQDEMYVAMKTGCGRLCVIPCTLCTHSFPTGSIQICLFPLSNGFWSIRNRVAQDRWDATDDTIKAAIKTAADDLWDRTNQYEADYQRELDAREKLTAGGIVWGDDYSDDDRAAFVGAVTEIWAELGRGSRR